VLVVVLAAASWLGAELVLDRLQPRERRVVPPIVLEVNDGRQERGGKSPGSSGGGSPSSSEAPVPGAQPAPPPVPPPAGDDDDDGDDGDDGDDTDDTDD
jgi:hypothetical protein